MTEAKVETRRISIDPITRLEGHGRIEIFLNDEDGHAIGLHLAFDDAP